jgi:hypothetical protein
MLNVTYAECSEWPYSDCHYVGFYYAECRGALKIHMIRVGFTFSLI